MADVKFGISYLSHVLFFDVCVCVCVCVLHVVSFHSDLGPK